MDKPLLALPYRGPSHSVEVLERVAQRETLRLGLPWTDLPPRRQNEFLTWAERLLDEALRYLRRDPLTSNLGFSPGGGIQTLQQLDGIEGRLHNRLLVHLEFSRAFQHFRDAIEGRDR